MGTDIKLQCLGLLTAFLLGVAGGVLYDVLRPLRYKTGDKIGILIDVAFSAAVGYMLFLYAMASSSARLGFWELSASFLGFIAYIYSLSKLFFPLLERIYHFAGLLIEKNKNFIKKIRLYRKNLFKKT